MTQSSLNKLRKITRDDWDMILELRNNSFEFFKSQKNTIKKKDHYKYMTRQMKNPNYFGYVYDDKVFVRILDNDVGVMTDPKFRNKGYATKALTELLKIHPDFYVNIDINNTNSFRLFLKISKLKSKSSLKQNYPNGSTSP